MIVRGVELALHPPGDYVSDFIRASGDFYEAAILDELARRVTGGVLIDVGAMIGNHTAYLAAFVPHTVIHAFEPMKANLRLLRRNVAPYPTVVVHPVALSDRAGNLSLTIAPDNLGNASVRDDGAHHAQAATLDSFGLEDVTLLKIDVEWHEPHVLAGARDTIARCRPLIVIEDWAQAYAGLLPGYAIAVDWGRMHQTYLYAPS